MNIRQRNLYNLAYSIIYRSSLGLPVVTGVLCHTMNNCKFSVRLLFEKRADMSRLMRPLLDDVVDDEGEYKSCGCRGG